MKRHKIAIKSHKRRYIQVYSLLLVRVMSFIYIKKDKDKDREREKKKRE